VSACSAGARRTPRRRIRRRKRRAMSTRACGERIEPVDDVDEVGQDASKIRIHSAVSPQLLAMASNPPQPTRMDPVSCDACAVPASGSSD
jgi:hypothetical protein